MPRMLQITANRSITYSYPTDTTGTQQFYTAFIPYAIKNGNNYRTVLYALDGFPIDFITAMTIHLSMFKLPDDHYDIRTHAKTVLDKVPTTVPFELVYGMSSSFGFNALGKLVHGNLSATINGLKNELTNMREPVSSEVHMINRML